MAKAERAPRVPRRENRVMAKSPGAPRGSPYERSAALRHAPSAEPIPARRLSFLLGALQTDKGGMFLGHNTTKQNNMEI